MSIINKILSFFSKRKSYREPAGSLDIEVTASGTLIKWSNNPFQMMDRRIISGANDKKQLIFLENSYRKL